jgi:hypothetical protein
MENWPVKIKVLAGWKSPTGDHLAFLERGEGLTRCAGPGLFFAGTGSRSAASRRAERSPPLGAPPSSFHRSMELALLRRLRWSGILMFLAAPTHPALANQYAAVRGMRLGA